jgi:hypothetical protein
LVAAVNLKTLKILTALLVINAHVGAPFLTRALESELRCGEFMRYFFVKLGTRWEACAIIGGYSIHY